MSRLTNLIKEVLRTPLHELEERFKVIDTRTGEVIDNDLPKKLAQKLAAKKKEWYPYPDKKESTIAKIARTLDESKKKDCNCGCNTCENVGNEGVLLNESVAPKQILSENLRYHVQNKLPLTENTFRYGSQSFIDLWAEARALYLREIIHVNDDDKEILEETDLGNYGMYEGKKVPLGLPMENLVNESSNRFKSLSAVDVKHIIDREYKEAQRVFGKAVDTRPTEEDYAAAEEYVKKKHGDKWHVEAIGINKTKNKIYIEAFENFTRSKHASFEDRRNKEHIIDRPKGIKESVNEAKKNKIIVWTDRNKKKQTIDLDASQLERAVSSGHDNDWNWNIDRIKQHIDRGEKEGTTDITRYDGGGSDTVYWESVNEGKFYPSTRIGSITNQRDIDEFDKDSFVQKMYKQQRIRVDELDTSYSDEWQIFIDKKDKEVIAFLKKNYPQYLQIDSYLAKQLAESVNEAAKKKNKKDPPIGKPKRGGPKAYYVYVRDPKTKRIKKVTFGSGGLKAKINNPKARQAFAKRHRCSEKTDKTKASYWSCRLPRYAKLLGLKSSFSGFW